MIFLPDVSLSLPAGDFLFIPLGLVFSIFYILHSAILNDRYGYFIKGLEINVYGKGHG